MEALHWLTGLAEPATLGTSLAIDIQTLEVRREAIARRPDCPVCGSANWFPFQRIAHASGGLRITRRVTRTRSAVSCSGARESET
jgi:hypothetical protein